MSAVERTVLPIPAPGAWLTGNDRVAWSSVGSSWDNGARPKGAGHTSRPLTHSSDLSREGLA